MTTAVGIAIFFCTAGWLLHRYYTARRPHRFPAYGYAGAAILLAGEALLLAGVEPVATYFTPTAWTGYILWADAAVFALRGRSLLNSYPAEFAVLAVFSVPSWLLFELYNLRLANWVYVGLPEDRAARWFGYAWSFATIWPGIFETAALWRALRPQQQDAARGDALSSGAARSSGRATHPWGGAAGIPMVLLGGLLLTVPVLLPPSVGTYLFGAVWLGFIFLLEPLNCRVGAESLWRDHERGSHSRLAALLAAGLICGIFWEFWNFWAGARWVYTVPILPGWKIFAMPLPGYLGFPPFAVECFALFAAFVAGVNRLLEKTGRRARFHVEALQL